MVTKQWDVPSSWSLVCARDGWRKLALIRATWSNKADRGMSKGFRKFCGRISRSFSPNAKPVNSLSWSRRWENLSAKNCHRLLSYCLEIFGRCGTSSLEWGFYVYLLKSQNAKQILKKIKYHKTKKKKQDCKRCITEQYSLNIHIHKGHIN